MTSQLSSETTTDESQVTLPSLAVKLVVKMGEAYGTSRTTYGRPIAMMLNVADSYGVFRTLVKKKMKQFKDIVWPRDGPIMMKPMQNASQANYEIVADDNLALMAQLTRLWSGAAQRKPGAFQVELVVYVQRRGQGTAIRRATAELAADATAQIGAHLVAQVDAPRAGPAAMAYWTVHQARQPPNAPLESPTSNTFAQLQFIDEQQELIDERERPQYSEFVHVRCRLNGGVILLELNLADLRARLELPSHGLLAPFQPPIAAAHPQENVGDIDHADDDGGGVF